MADFPFIGFLIGLDNLAAVIGLGLAGLALDRKLWLIGGFLVFETAMPVVGHGLGAGLAGTMAEAGEWLGAVFISLCGLLVLATALRHKTLSRFTGSPALLVLFALLLSFDNLLAGIGYGALDTSLLGAAMKLGVLSAAIGILGLVLGGALHRAVPRHAAMLGGVYLASLGVFLGAVNLIE